jgi:hypothetical protein
VAAARVTSASSERNAWRCTENFIETPDLYVRGVEVC